MLAQLPNEEIEKRLLKRSQLTAEERRNLDEASLKAARENYHFLLWALLEEGANPDTQDAFGNTGLALTGHYVCARVYIKARANVLLANQFGILPYTANVNKGSFDVARTIKKQMSLSVLADLQEKTLARRSTKRLVLNAMERKELDRDFLYACSMGNRINMLGCLSAGADPNMLDGNYNNGLFLSYRPSTTLVLLDGGTSPLKRSRFGTLPIDHHVTYNHQMAARLIRRHMPVGLLVKMRKTAREQHRRFNEARAIQEIKNKLSYLEEIKFEQLPARPVEANFPERRYSYG